MRLSMWSRRSLHLLLCLALAPGTTGCAAVLEAGLREMANDRGPTGAGQPFGTRLGGPGRSPGSNNRPAAITSGYQHGATIDWQRSRMDQLHTPAQSMFGRAAPGRSFCQPVPAGFREVFPGPTGPAGSELARLGPFEVGIAGPEGAAREIFASNPEVLEARAFASGARMAGEGNSCDTGLFLYVRLGRRVDDVSVLR